MSGFSALFFYRGVSYSRLLLGTSALILLAEVLLLRSVFRAIVRRSAKEQDQISIIIIGSDACAQKTSERLKNSDIAPCRTVAFVRIPGQRVEVEAGVPVFELEQLMSKNLKHFASDLVIAASAEMLPVLPTMIEQLKDLAIPIRFCLDFGPEVKMRERFFRIGGTATLFSSVLSILCFP
jgi:FlaA1/EpsC-like NDP-sugar epimerase